MSVTFFAAQKADGRRLFPCDCMSRWMTDCDAAGDMDNWPDPYSCERCRMEINLTNANAAELLRWLGVESECHGAIGAKELAARCRRRLWNETRNHDPGVAGFVETAPNRATVIYNGRREGYLREKTTLLLALAEQAGDEQVGWA